MIPKIERKLLVLMCAVLCIASLLISHTASADTLDLDLSSGTTYFEVNQDITVELEDDGYDNASIAFEATNNDEGPFELEKSGSTWSYDWKPEESGQYTIKLYVNGNLTSCDPDKITVYHEGYSAELETPWFLIFLIPGVIVLGIIMPITYLIAKKREKEAPPSAARSDRSEIPQTPPPFRAYKGSEPYVFVSYAHYDKAIIYKELEWLKKEGVHIWYDEGIPPSSEWPAEIERAILNCCVFMVFISPDAIASRHVRDELHFALKKQKTIIPVKIRDTRLEGTGLDMQMGRINFIGLEESNFRQKVLELLKAEANRKLNT